MNFKSGNYKYMSSRNNNFSNRAQKALIQVNTAASAQPPAPARLTASAVPTAGNSKTVTLVWGGPGAANPSMGLDGKANWDYDMGADKANTIYSYKVQTSVDGGSTWADAPGTCMNARTKSCQVAGLAAGTTVAFRALSYKDGA